MIVAVQTVDIAIFDARTLKDKRRVIKSLKQRLHNGFNISVAEVAYGERPKRCKLGMAMVGKESRPLHTQMDLAIDLVRRAAGVTLLDYQREFL